MFSTVLVLGLYWFVRTFTGGGECALCFAHMITETHILWLALVAALTLLRYLHTRKRRF